MKYALLIVGLAVVAACALDAQKVPGPGEPQATPTPAPAGRSGKRTASTTPKGSGSELALTPAESSERFWLMSMDVNPSHQSALRASVRVFDAGQVTLLRVEISYTGAEALDVVVSAKPPKQQTFRYGRRRSYDGVSPRVSWERRVVLQRGDERVEDFLLPRDSDGGNGSVARFYGGHENAMWWAVGIESPEHAALPPDYATFSAGLYAVASSGMVGYSRAAPRGICVSTGPDDFPAFADWTPQTFDLSGNAHLPDAPAFWASASPVVVGGGNLDPRDARIILAGLRAGATVVVAAPKDGAAVSPVIREALGAASDAKTLAADAKAHREVLDILDGPGGAAADISLVRSATGAEFWFSPGERGDSTGLTDGTIISTSGRTRGAVSYRVGGGVLTVVDVADASGAKPLLGAIATAATRGLNGTWSPDADHLAPALDLSRERVLSFPLALAVLLLFAAIGMPVLFFSVRKRKPEMLVPIASLASVAMIGIVLLMLFAHRAIAPDRASIVIGQFDAQGNLVMIREALGQTIGSGNNTAAVPADAALRIDGPEAGWSGARVTSSPSLQSAALGTVDGQGTATATMMLPVSADKLAAMKDAPRVALTVFGDTVRNTGSTAILGGIIWRKQGQMMMPVALPELAAGADAKLDNTPETDRARMEALPSEVRSVLAALCGYRADRLGAEALGTGLQSALENRDAAIVVLAPQTLPGIAEAPESLSIRRVDIALCPVGSVVPVGGDKGGP